MAAYAYPELDHKIFSKDGKVLSEAEKKVVTEKKAETAVKEEKK